MARVEEMERALTSRLVNNQSSHDSANVLPPIGQNKRDAAIQEDTAEHGNFGDRSFDESSMRKGTSGEFTKEEDEERLDEMQSQIRAARSDNIILRQDLQSFHDRESQLMRRNKDLEDKLLRQNDRHRVEPLEKDQKAAPVMKKAELDIIIDFTMPGKAVISQKAEKKVATVPPLEKNSEASFDSESWKVTVSSKHKLAALTGTPKTVVVSPMPRSEGQIAPAEAVEPRRVNEPDVTATTTTTTEQAPQRPKKKTDIAEIAKRERRLERRPKKMETTARMSVSRPPPPPSTALPQKLPTNDRFHDPIPKPGQFPSARPPRDHVPTRRRHLPVPMDHATHLSSTQTANGPFSPPVGVLPQQEPEGDRASDAVQQ